MKQCLNKWSKESKTMHFFKKGFPLNRIQMSAIQHSRHSIIHYVYKIIGITSVLLLTILDAHTNPLRICLLPLNWETNQLRHVLWKILPPKRQFYFCRRAFQTKRWEGPAVPALSSAASWKLSVLRPLLLPPSRLQRRPTKRMCATLLGKT